MRSTKPHRLAVVAALAISAAAGVTATASATTEPTDTTDRRVSRTTRRRQPLPPAKAPTCGCGAGRRRRPSTARCRSCWTSFAAESGINVTFEPQPEYDTTLQAALAAGDPPDIFYVDSLRIPDLVEAGALAPIPEGVITEPDDFYPSLTEAFTYDDTWYCPPKDFSTLGLVYNADMLEAAGVEPPTNLEELAAAAEALTADGVVGLVGQSRAPPLGRVHARHGGYIVDEDVTEMTLDTEENRAGLQYIADLFAAGYAATPAAVETGWGGEALGLGKAAMVIEGNWIVGAMAQDYPDVNWGVVEIPEGPAGRATFAFTVCYGVGAESPNPDASWQVIDYLTGPEGAVAWTEGFNVMPARQSAADGWIANHPELEPFVNGAEYAQDWQFTPGFTDVITEFNAQFEQLIAGDTDVDGLIEAVTEAGESVL